MFVCVCFTVCAPVRVCIQLKNAGKIVAIVCLICMDYVTIYSVHTTWLLCYVYWMPFVLFVDKQRPVLRYEMASVLAGIFLGPVTFV